MCVTGFRTFFIGWDAFLCWGPTWARDWKMIGRRLRLIGLMWPFCLVKKCFMWSSSLYCIRLFIFAPNLNCTSVPVSKDSLCTFCSGFASTRSFYSLHCDKFSWSIQAKISCFLTQTNSRCFRTTALVICLITAWNISRIQSCSLKGVFEVSGGFGK